MPRKKQVAGQKAGQPGRGRTWAAAELTADDEEGREGVSSGNHGCCRHARDRGGLGEMEGASRPGERKVTTTSVRLRRGAVQTRFG